MTDSLASGWYYAKRGAPTGLQAGPFTWQQLYSLAQTGALERDDLVWNLQIPEWIPARQVPGLFVRRDSRGAIFVPPVYQRGAWLPPTAPPPRRSSPLPWLIPIVILILVGGGLGIYFSALRDGGDGPVGAASTTSSGGAIATIASTTTTLSATTTPTTTTAPTTTTTAPAPSVWTDLNPVGDVPTARCDHALVYESTHGAVILFGGWAGGATYLNDTWAYDAATNTWGNQNPAGTWPPARSSHAMAYDSLNGKVIMFGGWSATGGLLDDTWAYDFGTNSWTNMSPAGAVPFSRFRHSMVYDSANGKVILFGGTDDTTHFNDTWAYDFTANTWTKLNPAGSLPPGVRLQQMVYDSVNARVILFGGTDNTTHFNDTWAYDPAVNTWANMNPAGSLPSARMSHTMAYDSEEGRAIVWGGWDGATWFQDGWAYDFVANAWTDVTTTGVAPSSRGVSSMVYNSLGRKIILFGGTQGPTKLNDTWAFGPAP